MLYLKRRFISKYAISRLLGQQVMLKGITGDEIAVPK